MLSDITVMVITLNEAANIRRTLDKLRWAERIVVVDSGSSDETLRIVGDYPQCEVFHRPFTDFASQCNFGIGLVNTPFVLSLDADYELSDDLIEEIRKLDLSFSGYRVSFVYRIHGRPLRGALYPPRIVLYRKDKAQYRNEGHGHRVFLAGEVASLRGVIYHDDRKPLSRWLSSQRRYAREEAEHLLTAPLASLNPADRVRRMAWPAPFLMFFYALLGKGCLFDGRPGWHYVLQRTLAEIMIALEIVDRRLQRPGKPTS